LADIFFEGLSQIGVILHLGEYGNFEGTCGNNSKLEMILTARKGAYMNTWYRYHIL